MNRFSNKSGLLAGAASGMGRADGRFWAGSELRIDGGAYI